MDPIQITEWESKIRTVENAPSRAIYPINALYLEVLGRATKQAWITMGYFIPDEPMMEALTAAAKRGVDVRVLIPRVLESHLRRLGGALPLRRAAARRRQNLLIRGSHGARQNHDR